MRTWLARRLAKFRKVSRLQNPGAGRTVRARLLHLDHDTDAAFSALYDGGFQGEARDPLRVASLAYFSSHRNDHEAHDSFFRNFTPGWSAQVRSGRHSDAVATWHYATELATQWEGSNPGERIHKGLAFYFWGVTALLSGDLDVGYSLMHQALSEDRLTNGRPDPPTPAHWFAVMDASQVDQAFRPWLQAQVDYLEPIFATYRNAYSKTLNLPDFGHRFLRLQDSSDSAARFGHAVARLMRFAATPNHVLSNDFAGQVVGEPLADILLVIEVGARARSGITGPFLAQATSLAWSAGLPLPGPDLAAVNAAQQGPKGINATLTELLDGAFVLASGAPLTGLGSDIAVAYALRNHGAHNVTGARVLRERRQDVQQAVINTLLLTVETWY